MSKKYVGPFPFALIFAAFSMLQLLWSEVDGEPKALFTAVFWEK